MPKVIELVSTAVEEAPQEDKETEPQQDEEAAGGEEKGEGEGMETGGDEEKVAGKYFAALICSCLS